MCSVESKPLFRDLTAEDPEPEVTQIESLCMNCHANGITKLLLTRIPHYKNVVIMSFSCEVCGYENNEIQPGGAFADKGIRWKLSVEKPEDLNRHVVKSDYTAVRVPEVQLEIPAQSQKGEVTTVEGLISRTISGLSQEQPTRRKEHPEEAKQIDDYLARLQDLLTLSPPFTVELEDVSGNTFVENPSAPSKDPRCVQTVFTRTKEQDHILGVFTHEEVGQVTPTGPILTPSDPGQHSYAKMAADEVMTFGTNCPECNAPADTNMKITNIPYFKEVVIMATVCDSCGHRTNEVKSGGGIEEQGVRFEVRIASKNDFSRDILKSETCTLSIPELSLESGGAALGGRFTTAEGVLRAVRAQLGDGITSDAPGISDGSVDAVIKQLDEVLECSRAVTLVLDDPAGNSYVQSLSDNPEEPDDGLKISRYDRNFEQNEELGLNDMKTEGYEQDG